MLNQNINDRLSNIETLTSILSKELFEIERIEVQEETISFILDGHISDYFFNELSNSFDSFEVTRDNRRDGKGNLSLFKN